MRIGRLSPQAFVPLCQPLSELIWQVESGKGIFGYQSPAACDDNLPGATAES